MGEFEALRDFERALAVDPCNAVLFEKYVRELKKRGSTDLQVDRTLTAWLKSCGLAWFNQVGNHQEGEAAALRVFQTARIEPGLTVHVRADGAFGIYKAASAESILGAYIGAICQLIKDRYASYSRPIAALETILGSECDKIEGEDLREFRTRPHSDWLERRHAVAYGMVISDYDIAQLLENMTAYSRVVSSKRNKIHLEIFFPMWILHKMWVTQCTARTRGRGRSTRFVDCGAYISFFTDSHRKRLQERLFSLIWAIPEHRITSVSKMEQNGSARLAQFVDRFKWTSDVWGAFTAFQGSNDYVVHMRDRLFS